MRRPGGNTTGLRFQRPRTHEKMRNEFVSRRTQNIGNRVFLGPWAVSPPSGLAGPPKTCKNRRVLQRFAAPKPFPPLVFFKQPGKRTSSKSSSFIAFFAPRPWGSGCWRGACAHCLAMCPRARRSTSARASQKTRVWKSGHGSAQRYLSAARCRYFFSPGFAKSLESS